MDVYNLIHHLIFFQLLLQVCVISNQLSIKLCHFVDILCDKDQNCNGCPNSTSWEAKKSQKICLQHVRHLIANILLILLHHVNRHVFTYMLIKTMCVMVSISVKNLHHTEAFQQNLTMACHA